MIELYAITDHPGPALPDVAPLKTVAIDGLAVVCAPAALGKLTPDALWRHEEVVEALMRDRDLLPVRYGTRVESEPAALQAVADRYDELAAALDRVRGAVELSLRVAAAGDGQVERDDLDGVSYMRARARAGAQRDTALRTIHEPLSSLARASRQMPAHTAGEVLRVAYLVDRHAVPGFTSLVARLDGAQADRRILCTGPWPPYSFAER